MSLTKRDTVIGGNGIIVQIDECKFGKRKYNQGHVVEGIWILGGVELTNEKKVFLIEVPDRSADTLTTLILQHVLPGSIIYTDEWKGYCRLHNHFEHYTVNHSKYYVDPDDGTTTNTIEGTWNGVKVNISSAHKTVKIRPHLNMFIWRRINKKNLWDSFLKSLEYH